MDDCKHEYTENYICMDCGLALEDYMVDNTTDPYSKSHQSNRAQRDPKLIEEIENLPVTIDCRTWMLESLDKVNRYVHKHGNRSKIIFAYCYLYHVVNDKDFDPSIISKILELDTKGVNDAIQIVSGTSSQSIFNNYTSQLAVPMVIITPIKYIPDLISNLDIDEENTSRIMTICNYIIKIDELLLDRNPKMIAAGVVHHYYDKMGWSTRNLGKKMGITNVQSKKSSKIVAKTICEFKKKL